MRKQYLFLILIFFLGVFLRFYHLSTNPPGLYIDEAAIGYNAYTILKTGRDEYGIPYPLTFRSFGDYKMPVYIYSTAGMMMFFGKTEFAVRITSALAGSLTVLILYFFARDMISFDSKQLRKEFLYYFPLLCSFLLAISPWHLQFSRGGFEVNLGLFFFLLAAWLALRFYLYEKNWTVILSIVFFATTIYTYHIYRVITPITVVLITLSFFITHKKKRISVIAACTLFGVLCLPMALFSLTPQGSERFAATSAFSEYPTKTMTGKIITNAAVYMKDYTTFYSLDFLFNNGDGIGRHQIPGFGVLPRWSLPFLLIGLYFVVTRRKSKSSIILLSLFFISPVAGALARPSPHSLRDLIFVIPAVMLTAYGMLSLLPLLKKKWMGKLLIGVFIVMIYETVLYFHFYYFHYPKTNIIDWGAGYKQIVLDASDFKKQYKEIVIDNNLGTTSIEYFHFYDNTLKPIYVNSRWHKPTDWNFPVLYIRPYYGGNYEKNIVHNIILPNQNHDIYAQFWKI